MISVEICIHSKDDAYVSRSVSSAWEGGAERIELCSHMEQDGLTPSVKHIELAREAFKDRPGLLAMIRPRGGNFFCRRDEVALMEQQIKMAARAGADGVVFGVLDECSSSVHKASCEQLLGMAREYELSVSFHRAFDATPDWQYALDTLLELGFDRVLTCGTPWGSSGTVLDGIERLVQMGAFAAGAIEIVAGGGVSPDNAPTIVASLRPDAVRCSLHAYSSMLSNGEVCPQKVRKLASADVVPN